MAEAGVEAVVEAEVSTQAETLGPAATSRAAASQRDSAPDALDGCKANQNTPSANSA